jgi:type II secretory pathway pseudopilin PulG
MLSMNTPRNFRHQRGLSIVELMVGIAVGLFVVAGAALVTATQLSDNRKLLVEAQLQQDLRSSADIVARELRRAGHTSTAYQTVWSTSASAVRNPFAAMLSTTGTTLVEFSYIRGPGQQGPYGFRLDSGSGALQSQLAAAGWQDLTDTSTLRITNLSIVERDTPAQVLPCPKLCTDGTDSCWPRVRARSFTVDIAGQAVGDAAVRRQLRTNVRVRNDFVRYMDSVNPDRICPL